MMATSSCQWRITTVASPLMLLMLHWNRFAPFPVNRKSLWLHMTLWGCLPPDVGSVNSGSSHWTEWVGENSVLNIHSFCTKAWFKFFAVPSLISVNFVLLLYNVLHSDAPGWNQTMKNIILYFTCVKSLFLITHTVGSSQEYVLNPCRLRLSPTNTDFNAFKAHCFKLSGEGFARV